MRAKYLRNLYSIYLTWAAYVAVHISHATSDGGHCTPVDVKARQGDTGITVEVEGGCILGYSDALWTYIARKVVAISIVAALGQQNEKPFEVALSDKGSNVKIDGGASWCIDVPNTGIPIIVWTWIVGGPDVTRRSTLVCATVLDKWEIRGAAGAAVHKGGTIRKYILT